ncbi:hypothetical protein IV203_037104 [Nitzschia inconspicua]|uniref:Uncharacterized protein n=1 Tax=Nitzschia inconspicua TaxID=303405 RepID=A0A9K3LKV8_9STRA|nr:hypothetical protein IV203_037104 [Nitzschia inconspicua]
MTKKKFTALHVGATWNLEEEEYDYCNIATSNVMMQHAQACANSDSCSLEEAQTCLDELLHVQMQCIGGGVLSTSALCDIDNMINLEDGTITTTVADIVDKLRTKIQRESQRLVWIKTGMNLVNIILGIIVVSMILHGIVADPHVPVDSNNSIMSPYDPDRAVVPFLPMEWIWAIRDGYLPLMMTQWFQHGGLVVDSTAYEFKAVPITPQEWIWSIQNGSFGHLLKENMKYGALRVDATSYTSEAIPLEAKEWWWAITGGYGNDAMQHFYRNGGL